MVDSANGVFCLDWILDLIEMTSNYPTPDVDSRQSFWLKVLNHCVQFAPNMKPRHKISLTAFLERLDLNEYFAEFCNLIEVDNSGPNDDFGWLEGKMVAVYTLTESAAKQAQSVLLKYMPGLDVRLNHEHAGTKQLKSLANNADVFVVVTQSAKHAATEFIQENRPSGKGIIFTDGKGSSSILKALEKHV